MGIGDRLRFGEQMTTDQALAEVARIARIPTRNEDRHTAIDRLVVIRNLIDEALDQASERKAKTAQALGVFDRRAGVSNG